VVTSSAGTAVCSGPLRSPTGHAHLVLTTEFTVLSTTVHPDEVDHGGRRWPEFTDSVCVHGRASSTGASPIEVHTRQVRDSPVNGNGQVSRSDDVTGCSGNLQLSWSEQAILPAKRLLIKRLFSALICS